MDSLASESIAGITDDILPGSRLYESWISWTNFWSSSVGNVDPSGRAKDCRCKAAFARDRRPVNSRTRRFLGLVLSCLVLSCLVLSCLVLHKMTPYLGPERLDLISSLICIISESGSIEKLIISTATLRWTKVSRSNDQKGFNRKRAIHGDANILNVGL